MHTKIRTNQKCQQAFHPSNQPFVYDVLQCLIVKLTADVQIDLVLSYCCCIHHRCHQNLLKNNTPGHETSQDVRPASQTAHCLQLIYNSRDN